MLTPSTIFKILSKPGHTSLTTCSAPEVHKDKANHTQAKMSSTLFCESFFQGRRLMLNNKGNFNLVFVKVNCWCSGCCFLPTALRRKLLHRMRLAHDGAKTSFKICELQLERWWEPVYLLNQLVPNGKYVRLGAGRSGVRLAVLPLKQQDHKKSSMIVRRLKFSVRMFCFQTCVNLSESARIKLAIDVKFSPLCGKWLLPPDSSSDHHCRLKTLPRPRPLQMVPGPGIEPKLPGWEPGISSVSDMHLV